MSPRRISYFAFEFIRFAPLIWFFTMTRLFKKENGVEPTGTGTREQQIIKFAAQGHTDKEIAEHLGLSPNTIYTYWRRVRARYGSSSRGEAISRYLHETFEHLRLIVDLSPDAILITQNNRICFASPGAATLFGVCESESLVGTNVRELIDAEATAIVEERRRRSETNGLSNPYRVFRGQRKDGVPIQVEVATSPIQWQNKPASLTIMRDVTSDLQIAEDTSFAIANVETLPDIMYLMSAEGTYLDYRASQRAQPVVPPDTLLGRHYRDAMPKPVVDALDVALPKLKVNRSDVTAQYEVAGKGRCLARLSLLKDGRVLILIRLLD